MSNPDATGPLVLQTKDAAERVRLLLLADQGAVGVRLTMKNDWANPSGFSYTLGFVKPGEMQASDEKIEIPGGGVLYVDRKAIWAGEGGLLGATIDIDEKFNVNFTPREPKA